MKKLTIQDKVFTKNRVRVALEAQFETYAWEEIIDDCGLEPHQAKWAKENLGYVVKDYSQEGGK